MATEISDAIVRRGELEQRALDWAAKASAIKIIDQSSYDRAADLHKGILGLLDEIDAVFDKHIHAAHDAHKNLIAEKKKVQGSLPEGEKILRSGIARWEAEQETLRREAQRKAEDEARRAEEEVRLALAAQAKYHGASAEAIEDILMTPLPIVAPVIAPTFARQEGYSKPIEHWSVEVIDIIALCRAIGEGSTSREFVLPNLPALNAEARARKSTFIVPGCRVVVKKSISVRR